MELKSMIMKDISKMGGDQLFREHTMSAKRIERYQEILDIEKLRYKLLTDEIYRGRPNGREKSRVK